MNTYPHEQLNESLSITKKQQPRILIVDDEPANIQVLRGILSGTYQTLFAKSGEQAIELINNQLPDLILMDVIMPGMSGYDVLEALRLRKDTTHIPIIFITSMPEEAHQVVTSNEDNIDFISKPVDPSQLIKHTDALLSKTRKSDLNRPSKELVHCLCHALQYKEDKSGNHAKRLSHYVSIIGKAVGLSEEECELLSVAAPLHDIGKVSVPDQVLLKQSNLSDKDWRFIKRYPTTGYQILSQQESPVLQLAAVIALTHHEKWNGTGYPKGLKGKDIPLEGRIVALANVFDALTTSRPHRPAWSVDKALNLIVSESGEHFDPRIVPLFLDHIEEILAIQEQWPVETDLLSNDAAS